jgi:hypothetical protein
MCYLDSPSRLVYNFCTSVQVFAVQLTSDHASRHKPLLLATCQLSRRVGSARAYRPAWVSMTGTYTLLDATLLLKISQILFENREFLLSFGL